MAQLYKPKYIFDLINVFKVDTFKKVLVFLLFIGFNNYVLEAAETPQIKGIITSGSDCAETSGSILIETEKTPDNYTFLWSPDLGIGSQNQRDSLPAGVYTITITDIASPTCPVTRTVIVGNVDGPDAVLAFTSNASCQQTNGRAILAPIDFTYRWFDGVENNNRSDLLAGSYIVTVVEPFNGCENYIAVEIEENNPLSIQIIDIQSADCSMANGQVQLLGGGGSGNYSYNWSDGGVGATRNDLSAGTYHITLTDNSPNGCNTITEMTIIELNAGTVDLMVNQIDNITCLGDQNGGVQFEVTINSPITLPLDTLITDSTNQTFTNGNLGAGNYCLTIRDGNNCLAAQNCFTIFNPPTLEVDVRVTDKGCTNLGAINLQVSGGNGNYIFDWADFPGTNDPGNRGSLEPDTYQVSITDANLCLTVIREIVIVEDCITGCQVDGGTITTSDPTIYCVNDGIDDLFTFQRTGNVGPNFGGLLTNASGEILQLNNSVFNLEGLPAGTCTVYGIAFDNTATGITVGGNISDIQGCTDFSNSIDIIKLTGANCNAVCNQPVIANVVVANASCTVDDGSITIETTTDPAQFNYSWFPNVGNGPAVDSLAIGTYQVTISDVNNSACSTIRSFSVGTTNGPEATILSTTPASCKADNGTALLSPQIYQYDWCGGQTGFNPVNLEAGVCAVTITDPSTQCTNIIEVVIDTLAPFNITVDITAPDCGQANGQVAIDVDSGSTFYTYDWSNGANTDSLGNLSAGVYEVTVTDLGPNNCVEVLTFALTETNIGASLAIDTLLFTSCPGLADVFIDPSATIFEPGFPLPASFQILNARGDTATNGQIGPGDYCFLIFDNTGCLAGQNCFEVRDPAPIHIEADIINLDCDAFGQATIIPTGGAAPYTYDWADIPGMNDPNERTDLDLGTYSVTVTDANNCTAAFNGIEIVDACVPCPVKDTMNVSIAANTSRTVCVPLEDYCFDRTFTFFSLTVGGLSGSSSFGDWVLSTQGCLEYTANNSVGNGLDSILVIAGFNGLVDTTCIFITITDDPDFNPGADTLFLRTNENTAIDTCLDLSALTGNLGIVSLISPPNLGALSFDSNDSSCVSYLPNASITGNFIDTLAIELCDINDICDTSVLILSVIPANCPDFLPSNRDSIVEFDCGQTVSYCLDIPAFDIINYQLFVNGENYNAGFNPCNSEIQTGYDLNELLIQFPGGPYVLDSWEVGSQTFSIDTFFTLQQLTDSLLVWDPAGQWSFDGNSKIIGGIPGGNYGQLVIREVGVLVQVRIDLFSNDIALGTQIELPIGNGQLIVNDLVSACQDTIWFVANCPNCPDVYFGPDVLIPDDCNSLAELCLEIDIVALPAYEIFDNGLPYTGAIEACRLDSNYTFLVSDLQQGPFRLDSWIVDGDTLRINSFNSAQELVDAMNVFDPTGNWQLIGPVISGGALGKNYEALLVSQNTIPFPPINPNLQQIPLSISIQLDTGFHQIVLSDTLSACIDTLNILVDCSTLITPVDTFIQLVENGLDSLCYDLSIFNTISSIENICPDDSNGNADWTFNNSTDCFEFSGLLFGLDTFCLEVCDSTLGLCDTFNIGVSVIPAIDTQIIELLLGFTDTLCLDTTLFQTNIDTFYNDCPSSTGNVDVQLLQTEYCVQLIGEALGTDSACLVICDELDFCDTTILILYVVAPQPDTIRTFVGVGDTSSFCLDTSELSLSVDTLLNFCDGSSGAFVDFTLDQDSICVTFEGIDQGLDTACLVICDALICDTTILIIEAIRGSTDPPIAVNDTLSTTRNNSILIDLLLNDTINGTNPMVVILDAPLLGALQINPNQTFTYVPDLDVCERVDSFTYILSTSTGADTATVVVSISCEDLTIFNGFSPNADGVNDTWVIPGIENFSNHEVCVFNRWGNKIFCTRNYLNAEAWDGRWEGKDLPDGTYFYVIDNGEGEQFSGYVQLHR